MEDKSSQRQKYPAFLILILFLGISLRCVMPFYLIITRSNYSDFMNASSYAQDMIALSIGIAKGEGIHTGYYPYAVQFRGIATPSLDKIKREPTGRKFYLDKGGLIAILIASGITFCLNSFNVAAVQICQGIVDSLGCLLVFAILGFYFNRRVCLLGALLYAAYPPLIFYSYHLMSEAYVPILMLAIGYALILALDRGQWFWFALTGFLIGLSLSVRADNFLILPICMLYMLWFYRNKIWNGMINAMLIFTFCALSLSPFKMIVPQTTAQVATLGSALYNSLGEYPGIYRGLRFFHDQATFKYGTKKSEEYLKNGDLVFKTAHSIYQHCSLSKSTITMESQLIAIAYFREVVIGKPVLYFGWLTSRFFAYLPAHPFLACIAYFFKQSLGYRTMLGYRYSQMFHLVKYLDYFLFLLFIYGVWLCRNHTKMLSLLCIYFAVLISHVIVGCGEVYFQLDKEYAYLDPRYLLGMVSIWPIFIAVAVSEVREGVLRRLA